MSNISRSKQSRPRGPKPGADRKTTPRHAEVSELEAHLGYWLRAVSNHVSHAFKAKVERQGVTVAEWVVLRALFDGEGVKPSELAAKIGLTRGAISKLVDRLLAKDLVSVRDDVHDGRAQIVALRASGRRLVPKLAALADENDAQAFGHLGREQRAFLLATLKELVEQLGLRGAPVD
jgi:DNA-binding MarR family transcriptional regulator